MDEVGEENGTSGQSQAFLSLDLNDSLVFSVRSETAIAMQFISNTIEALMMRRVPRCS